MGALVYVKVLIILSLYTSVSTTQNRELPPWSGVST